MSYQDLPVEERMEKAAEFALLSIDSDRPQEEIIREIQDTFYLDKEEAQAAYERMRKNYKQEYSESVNKSINRGLVYLVVSIVAGGFYMVLAQEVVWSVVFAVLFFASALGAVLHVAQKLLERFSSPERPVIKSLVWKDEKGRDKMHWTVQVLFLSFFFWIVSAFLYFNKTGYVELSEVVHVKDLWITDEVAKGKTGGKSPSYYYEFAFHKFNHQFRLFDDYYQYAQPPMQPGMFQKGDSVEIVLRPKEAAQLNWDNTSRTLDMVNIYKGGVPLIDLAYRNRQVLEKNQNLFYIMSGVFTGLLLLIIGWYQQQRLKLSRTL